jgi:hypothetical protein
MFGSPVNGSLIDEDKAFYLTEGKVGATQIMELPAIERARLIASSRSMTFNNGRSLVEIFGVSSTAMAIQLLRTRLVA